MTGLLPSHSTRRGRCHGPHHHSIASVLETWAQLATLVRVASEESLAVKRHAQPASWLEHLLEHVLRSRLATILSGTPQICV